MTAARAGKLSLALTIAAVLAATGDAHAQTFTFASQNALHLGWGSNKTLKYQYFKAMFGQYDVILIQELMPKYTLVVVPADGDVVNPGTYTWEKSDAAGTGGYNEQYGFLVKNVTTTPVDKKVVYGGGGFSRPPAGILLQTGANATWTWLVNFHAVFGRSVTLRQAEAKAMATVYQLLALQTDSQGKTHNRILICGDWNLPTSDTDSYAPLMKLVDNIQPTGPSSLTPQGAPSSEYDHCAWNSTAFSGNTVSVSLCAPQDTTPYCGTGGPPYAAFRSNVSDHLGIIGSVK
jgi:hypothetical protein